MTSPRLATMGMFIIDEFQFLDPTSGKDLGNRGLEDQIGGGGCYFAIGARVFLPPSSIQMVIDRGSDWREQDQAVLDRFDRSSIEAGPSSMWHYRSRPGGTTRAVNIYKGEHRGFNYLSPKIRLEPKDLLQCSTADPKSLPEWIHFICSPERALESISQIDDILAKDSCARAFPKLVYEPIPDSCVFENLQDCLKVLPRLAVFSPNHEEAADLLGLGEEWQRALQQALSDTDCTTDLIVRFITNKLASGFTKNLQRPEEGEGKEHGPFGPIICIRSGAWGSVVGQAGLGFRHVPAWHTSPESSEQGRSAEGKAAPDTSSSRIKDVTGAGNSFLGGFSAHLVQTQGDDEREPMDRLVEAARHGAVSASLVIEQLGLPSFDVKDGQELWNGHTAAERLDLLRARLS